MSLDIAKQYKKKQKDNLCSHSPCPMRLICLSSALLDIFPHKSQIDGKMCFVQQQPPPPPTSLSRLLPLFPILQLHSLSILVCVFSCYIFRELSHCFFFFVERRQIPKASKITRACNGNDGCHLEKSMWIILSAQQCEANKQTQAAVSGKSNCSGRKKKVNPETKKECMQRTNTYTHTGERERDERDERDERGNAQSKNAGYNNRHSYQSNRM